MGPRLPRTRGDTPPSRPKVSPSAWAPPHARGYTLTRHHPSLGAPGSPEHAGIHPSLSCGALLSSRLPRTCGDTPAQAAMRCHRIGAPPHARGYTLGSCQAHRS